MRVNNNTNLQAVDEQPKREPVKQLGKDEFLKILITQLRNQDPLNPMEDRDFIAQMAQFSTLEQMQNMSADFTAMKGMNLIGRMVFAETYVEGTNNLQLVAGRVEQVTFISGRPYLRVSGYDLTVDEIIQVLSEDEAQKLEEEPNKGAEENG